MSSQQTLPADLAETIARCDEASGRVDRLRDEVNVLRLASDPAAQFATALFDLELAQQGDPEARERLVEVADALLVYWREGTGAELAALHPALEGLWASASSLLVGFEVQRFEHAVATCWRLRRDPSTLGVAIEGLLPQGNRRVEFARCLYHLELARLAVEGSRVEFARRAWLLAEAYQAPEVAAQLVGKDPGLAELWAELEPYLDEFFESLEEQAERRQAAAPSRAEVKTDPGISPLSAERQVPSFRTLTGQRGGETTPVESPAQPPTEPTASEGPPPQRDTLDELVVVVSGEVEAEAEAEALGAPPPPPGDLTPPGSWVPPRTISGELEVVQPGFPTPLPQLPPPPPPPRDLTPVKGVPAAGAAVELTGDDLEQTPDDATLAFWSHTFDKLQLMPSDHGRSARILACDTRTERKHLSDFVDSLGAHVHVPEARAMGGLIRLMLAGQTKEKTLFGQANPRRAEAMAAALPLLASSPEAAGHAAVWFELDGPDTQSSLHRGLELLVDYLGFCNRVQRDPLSPDTVAMFAQR